MVAIYGTDSLVVAVAPAVAKMVVMVALIILNMTLAVLVVLVQHKRLVMLLDKAPIAVILGLHIDKQEVAAVAAGTVVKSVPLPILGLLVAAVVLAILVM